MKFLVFSFGFALFFQEIQAQTNKLVAGSKLQIVQVAKMNNKSSMMGQDIESSSDDSAFVAIEIKSVADSVVVLNSTVTRIIGKASAMGQEQTFDSDDKSTTNNPSLAGLFKGIKKTDEFTVVNGKIKTKPAAAKAKTDDGANDLSKMLGGGLGGASSSTFVSQLFIPSEAKNKKLGDKWTAEDNSADGKTKSVTIFAITKLTKEDVEITANISSSVSGNMQIMGMDMKQNITATTTSIYSYSLASGLLKAGVQSISSSGTGEVMGTTFPINLKGTTTIWLQ